MAQVYPDLMVRDQNGRVQTVQYHKPVPILLNELQQELQALVTAQGAQLAQLKAQSMAAGR